MTLLALLLGASATVYILLHRSAIGFTFPTLHGEWPVRPTFGRVTAYLFGRWTGYLILGGLLGWAGAACQAPVMDRLAFAGSTLFAIFIFLFLATEGSPELQLALMTQRICPHASTLFLGLCSSFTPVAPVWIAIFLALTRDTVLEGLIFFTNFFIGSTLSSLPLLLNQKWVKRSAYLSLVKLGAFFCSALVLLLSIASLLRL